MKCLLDHLEELRASDPICLAIVLMGSVAFIGKDFIFDTLFLDLKKLIFHLHGFVIYQNLSVKDSFCINEMPFRIQSRTVAGQFSAHLWTSFCRFYCSISYVIFEFWKFVSPGLHENERKMREVLFSSLRYCFLLG